MKSQARRFDIFALFYKIKIKKYYCFFYFFIVQSATANIMKVVFVEMQMRGEMDLAQIKECTRTVQ